MKFQFAGLLMAGVLLVVVSAAQSEAELDGVDGLFGKTRRSLYSTALDAQACEACMSFGKKHCWRKRLDYTGYWTQSYCCGPADRVCNSYTICSNEVSNKRLKKFTCPVPRAQCPISYLGEIRTRTPGVKVKHSESWSTNKIRRQTFCKLNIQHLGPYTTDKGKQLCVMYKSHSCLPILV